MAIEDILKRIDEESEAAVEEVLEAARREAETIRAAYSKRAEDFGAELRLRAEKRAQEEEKRLVVNEQLDIRKALLARKHEILNALYENARRRIEKMPRERYRDLIKRYIIARAVSGGEEIVASTRHREIFTDDFIKELRRAFPGGGNFTIADQAGDFGWGVVLREGRRVVNLSLDVLFEQLRERVEPQIAAVLFPAAE
jgi:vacuolar-type H+-ATPase subunit E/Vma4